MTAPQTPTLIGGSTDGTGAASSVKPLKVNSDGSFVLEGTLSIDSTGLATSAKQDTGNTSVASIDGKVGASAAPTDAKTNASAASGFVQTFLSVFNGTTWDRIKSGVVAVGSTFTGMLNTLPLALYNSSPATRTTGQGAPLETDATGNLRTTEQFLPASSVTSITTATTTLVKSGAGRLARLIICTPAASATIAVHDALTAVNQVMPTITFPAALVSDGAIPIELQFAFNTGLTIVTTGTTSVAVVWD